MPAIAELNQTREDRATLDRIGDLQALYEGGPAFKARLKKFLPAKPFEPKETHEARKAESVYRNYIGPIVDYFASMLFAERPVAKAKRNGEELPDPGEYYAKFREDSDRNGADLDAIFKDRLTSAMVSGVAWLRVHAPSAVKADSLAEYEQLGLGDCWLQPLDYCQVLDWETDDYGRLEWILTHKVEAKRKSLSGDRKTVTESWQFTTAELTETYALTYHVDRKPAENTEVPLVSSEPHPFGRVPFVALQLPVGLWVASRLETPQLAHYRLSNAQTWGLSRSCYAMPVLKLEDQDRPPVMGAGIGIVLGVEEALEWASPTNVAFEALANEIKSQKDEIYRVVHQMAAGVDNNAAAVGRSADSKATDAAATRVVLQAYSKAVKEAIEVVYDMIAKARGDHYEWTIDGLDDFAAVDVAGFADTLAAIDKAGGIPSKTFQIQAKQRLAEAFLRDLDESTKADIRKEIKANTKDPAEEPDPNELMLEGKPPAIGKQLPAAPPF